MRIFISYSTRDLQTAETVFGELVAAGAEAFQFGRSDIIGKPSWEQVLNWISESDVFIVLISASALKSKPVREEIGHAHHSYINSDKPDKIVSAIIETGVKPPRLIERFTTVDFVDYGKGMARLMDQLGLQRRPAAKASAGLSRSLALPDFGPLFSEYKKKHPEPTPAEEFSVKAEKIVANYDAVKPPELTGANRAKHIDQVLAELSGGRRSPKLTSRSRTFDRLFLGFDPGPTSKPGAAPGIAEALLHWTPRDAMPLPAPELTSLVYRLSWTGVPGAMGYALEESGAFDFQETHELYRGPDLLYNLDPKEYSFLKGRFFRVKAVGGVFRADSPWSNVITRGFVRGAAAGAGMMPWMDSFEDLLGLPAPELTLTEIGTTVSLSWSKVEGASGYVLERTLFGHFATSAEVIYDGSATIHLDTPLLRFSSYRVKAKGGKWNADSPWSNVVTWMPRKRK